MSDYDKEDVFGLRDELRVEDEVVGARNVMLRLAVTNRLDRLKFSDDESYSSVILRLINYYTKSVAVRGGKV